MGIHKMEKTKLRRSLEGCEQIFSLMKHQPYTIIFTVSAKICKCGREQKEILVIKDLLILVQLLRKRL